MKIAFYGDSDTHHTACYEYKGSLKNCSAHGNSIQNKDPYIRLKPEILQRIKESICNKPITQVYDEEDILHGPRSMQQVSLHLLEIFA